MGELKEIARLRRIKNIEKLTKEGLIITSLKLETSAEEQNIKKKKSQRAEKKSIDQLKETARLRKTKNIEKLTKEELIFAFYMIFSGLGNIVTNKDRKKIEKEPNEIVKRNAFHIMQKKKFMIILSN